MSLHRSVGVTAIQTRGGGQQYCGSHGDADVIGLPGIHVEVKRVERLDLLGAMSQAIGDARETESCPLLRTEKITAAG